MTDRYDIVIIGAGIAGLVCGNYLLDRGRRVLIIEKEKYPGGCACSFERKGYRFDAAVHWISQAGEGGIVNKVLTDLGLDGGVGFKRLPRPATVIVDDRRIDLEFGMDGLVRRFADAFPDEKSAIESFWADTDDTKEELWRLIKNDPARMGLMKKFMFNATFPLKFSHIAKYHKKKASEVIGKRFKDDRLKRAFNALGIFPDISFVHYSWFNSVGLDADAYYPDGGIQAVPDALAARFMDNGGEIRYGSRVGNIIVEDGAARGVVIEGGEDIPAGIVVSAGDATNTYLKMVGEDRLPKKFAGELKSWKPSESFFYVYLGVDMDLRGLGFDGTPVWYLPPHIDKANFPMLGSGAIGIGMPSLLDPSLAPKGRNIVILGAIASCIHMAGCPVRAGESENGRIYKAVKQKVEDYLIELAGDVITGLGDAIEVKVSATPHTFERYTMNTMGASSGWSMAADAQHKLSIRTPISGLYLTGHWTMNPGGVPAAFVSGMLAAEEISGAR